EAARLVLAARLEVVAKYLPLAVHEASRDAEHVHQLRVGTRRGDAALRIFRDCLPGRTYRHARQRLRTIRRAAGAARDWDVFLQALHQRLRESSADDLPGLDFLTGHAMGQRTAAQAGLGALAEEEPFSGFAHGVLDEVRSQDDQDMTPLAHARVVLARL